MYIYYNIHYYKSILTLARLGRLWVEALAASLGVHSCNERKRGLNLDKGFQ